MAYNANLAARVRRLLRRRKGFSEKTMFGGVGFLLGGNMCCGVLRDDVILRLGVDTAEQALGEYGFRPFDITGRVMRGWAMAGPPVWADPDALKYWVRAAASFAGSLPPKQK